MGGHHAGLITAGAVPSSVPSCSKRTKTSTPYYYINTVLLFY